MLEISSYINIPVAIALWAIGFIIKHYIPSLSNKIIPIILMLSGIGVAFAFDGVSKESFSVGLATALISVGAHSSGKQLFNFNGLFGQTSNTTTTEEVEEDETDPEVEEDTISNDSNDEEPMG